MNTGRLEAFSDGVIAIIITIMVLELKVAARRSDLARAAALAAGVFQLRAELRLRRHLLEQSSSHVARHQAGHRRHPVGQSASVVLAVAVSLHHGVDRRKPFGAGAVGGVRRGAADGGHRLFHLAAAHHRLARLGLAARSGPSAAIGRASSRPRSICSESPPRFGRRACRRGSTSWWRPCG